MTLKREYISVTTDADGDGVGNGTRTILGKLYCIKWIDGTFADGVDAVISCVGGIVDTTLLTLTNADNDAMYYPRNLVHSEAGAALTGTSGGDRDLMVIDGKIKIVVSNGGNVATGGAIIYWLE